MVCGLPWCLHIDGDDVRSRLRLTLGRRGLGGDRSQHGSDQAVAQLQPGGASLWRRSGLPLSVASFSLQTDLVHLPVADKHVEEGETEEDQSEDDSTPYQNLRSASKY